MKNKNVFITLDLEPDCGGRVHRYDSLGNVDQFVNQFEKFEVPITIFTVGEIFEQNKEVIKKLQNHLDVEFAVHSYSHQLNITDRKTEIEKGVKAFENYFGEKPYGYRAPQGKISSEDFATLENLGIRYDSSIIPSFRPGVYSNITSQKKPFVISKTNILEIPISVSGMFPIPLGLGYMRMLGNTGSKLLFKTLKSQENLIFYFHLHDVIPSKNSENLTGFAKILYSRNVREGFKILSNFISNFKTQNYNFKKMKDLLNNH